MCLLLQFSMCLLLRIPTLFGIRGGSKWTRFFAYMAFSSHITVRVLLTHWSHERFRVLGGSKWTRTTDLTLIRRAL